MIYTGNFTMNYLETGLPHTEFFPKKTFFSPPRSIPMSGLSRKYMGLEPVTKREINAIINRLSKPKKRPVQEDPIKIIREARPMTAGTGRFVGHKRMSSLQIEKMVARLYNRRSTKEFAFVDEMPDPTTVSSGLDDDSETESGEAAEEPVAKTVEKPVEKPSYDRKNSILRKDSASGLRAHMNVSFQEIDIPKLNLDTPGKGSDSTFKETSPILPRRSSVQKTKDSKQSDESKSSKSFLQENFKSLTRDNVKKSELSRSATSSSFKHAKLETSVRPSTSDPRRSPSLTRESQRPSTSESPQRSPRLTRQNLARHDEETKHKSENRVPRIPTPCDDLLIDRVATYNRSPRARKDVNR